MLILIFTVEMNAIFVMLVWSSCTEHRVMQLRIGTLAGTTELIGVAMVMIIVPS